MEVRKEDLNSELNWLSGKGLESLAKWPTGIADVFREAFLQLMLHEQRAAGRQDGWMLYEQTEVGKKEVGGR